ncbi:MAG: CDP-diacylglycerol--glycerol-3-phosphate 3-phosphatidyltransferase [Clostridia bacterium]|nr:CDP-diacylglycerol--glycerol-3-phosphate 3-phosphatidyltransferase [Clostridia bacterium]
MNFKWNVPNVLTMVRIFCTPLMIALFLIDIPNGIGYFCALGVYVLACLTDFLDGYIARKYNLVTDFGKFMDQIADKFITTTAIILVLFKIPTTLNWLAIVIVLIVVLRDILISGVRMVAANNDVVIAADIFGKIKSFFLDIASMVMMLYIGLTCVVQGDWLEYVRIAGLSLMIVGVLLCIVSCVNYIVNATKALNEKKVD